MYGSLFLLLCIVNFFVCLAMDQQQDPVITGEGGNSELWGKANNLSDFINTTYDTPKGYGLQEEVISYNNNQNSKENKLEIDTPVACKKYTAEKNGLIYCPDLDCDLKFIQRASSTTNKQLYVHFYNHKNEAIYFKYVTKDALSEAQWKCLGSREYASLEYDANAYLCFAENESVILENIDERAKDCSIRKGQKIMADNVPFVIQNIIPGDYRILVLNSIHLQTQKRTTINSYFVQSNNTGKNIWIQPLNQVNKQELLEGLVLKPNATVYIADIFDNKDYTLLYGVYPSALEDNTSKVFALKRNVSCDALKYSTKFTPSQEHNDGKYTLKEEEGNVIANSCGYKSTLQKVQPYISQGVLGLKGVYSKLQSTVWQASSKINQVVGNTAKDISRHVYSPSSTDQKDSIETIFCPVLEKDCNVYISQKSQKIIFHNSLSKPVTLIFVKERSLSNKTEEFSSSYEIPVKQSMEIEWINGSDLYIAHNSDVFRKGFDESARKMFYRYKSEFDNNDKGHKEKAYAPICIQSEVFKDTRESLFVIGRSGKPAEDFDWFTFKLYKKISNPNNYDMVIQTYKGDTALYMYGHDRATKVPAGQSRLVRTPLCIDPNYKNKEYLLDTGMEKLFEFPQNGISNKDVNLAQKALKKRKNSGVATNNKYSSEANKRETVLSSINNTTPVSGFSDKSQDKKEKEVSATIPHNQDLGIDLKQDNTESNNTEVDKNKTTTPVVVPSVNNTNTVLNPLKQNLASFDSTVQGSKDNEDDKKNEMKNKPIINSNNQQQKHNFSNGSFIKPLGAIVGLLTVATVLVYCSSEKAQKIVQGLFVKGSSAARVS